MLRKRTTWVLAAVAATSLAAAMPAMADAVFSQGFNTAGDTSGWYAGGGYGSIQQVASGTNGINAAEGAGYAVVNANGNSTASGPYTFFNQPGGPFSGAYTASIDIYLDPSWVVGSGFDWDVAPSDGAGNYGGPDYIFHVDESSAGQLLIGAGYNSSNSPPATPTDDPNAVTVTTAGWYTFTSSFVDNGGALAATLTVSNTSGTVFSEAMSSPGALNGVDYGWFNFASVGPNGLAIDNSELNVVPLPSAAGMGLLTIGALALGGLLRKKLRRA